MFRVQAHGEREIGHALFAGSGIRGGDDLQFFTDRDRGQCFVLAGQGMVCCQLGVRICNHCVRMLCAVRRVLGQGHALCLVIACGLLCVLLAVIGWLRMLDAVV